MDDYYDRRGPPRDRGYSPRRDDYRRRSPPPRYYDDPRDDRYGPPPRRGGPPPVDDYPPPRRYVDDRYGAPPGPPPRGGPGAGYEPEPYVNGHGREPAYGGRPPSPRGDRRGGGGYDRGYDRPAYW
jgi:transcription initiation factor TFIID subunit 15